MKKRNMSSKFSAIFHIKAKKSAISLSIKEKVVLLHPETTGWF